MNEEQDLLRRVLTFPDDDAPRLAYADYMNQRGDPRGQFIQVGVALGRINGNSADPNFLPFAQSSNLMIEEYGPALAGPIANLVDRYSFDRGFVELVEMTAGRFIELAPRLYTLAPVRHLDLTNVRPVIRELFASPHLDPILSLSLQGCKLKDGDIQILAASSHLKNLRWLSIADNAVGMAGAEALAATGNLPHLGYVVFDGNPVNPSMQFGHDQGVITDFSMPEEGRELERKYGRIRWLRTSPRTLADLPPSRFVP